MKDAHVATPEAVGLIGEVIQSWLPNARQPRRGIWAAPLSTGITALVTVDHWKGGTFSVGYGVCCAWVPYSHRNGLQVEWPTSTRLCVKHLWVDHFTIDAPTPRHISQLDGARTLQRQARRAVRYARREADAWWTAVSSIEGVLIEAQRQSASSHDLHWPRSALVVAFTLARLNDLPAAQQTLAALSESMTDKTEDAERLASLLEATPHRFDAGLG